MLFFILIFRHGRGKASNVEIPVVNDDGYDVLVGVGRDGVDEHADPIEGSDISTSRQRRQWTREETKLYVVMCILYIASIAFVYYSLSL